MTHTIGDKDSRVFLGKDIPKEGPQAPSFDDHPANYFDYGERQFVFGQVALADVTKKWGCPGGHGAHCYLPTPENERRHDVSPDDPDEGPGYENYDFRYVQRMAAEPHKLPALVMLKEGSFGGGHRTAAWKEAGWSYVPAWIEQSVADSVLY